MSTSEPRGPATLSASAILKLYDAPVSSTRKGVFFNLHSYPTKINPEAIVPFILGHTKPGEVVLDGFAGSGSTGIAALMCGDRESTSTPNPPGAESGIKGPRTAYLTDVSALAQFIGSVVLDPPDPQQFRRAADELLAEVARLCSWMYSASGPDGSAGELRHAIWTEHIRCPECLSLRSFWDAAVTLDPPTIRGHALCPCGHEFRLSSAERLTEEYADSLVGETRMRRARSLARIYGATGSSQWQRLPTDDDVRICEQVAAEPFDLVPLVEVLNPDMELFRRGYHFGIRYLHDFYTRRNLLTLSRAWNLTSGDDSSVGRALRLWISSYNVSHSTLMSRIVAKRGGKELVVTSGQPGALYVSSLPVEKNVIRGLIRKLDTMARGFTEVRSLPRSQVEYRCGPAYSIPLPDDSVDYVFTDPPFGDNIQYAEVHRLSEAWLGTFTDETAEIVVSGSAGKSLERYGDLMERSFREFHRVLKPGRPMTLVFHSSDSLVWRAVERAWQAAGFDLVVSSTLNKTQSSFKQNTTENSVAGDLVMMLEKRDPNKVGSQQLVFLREDESSIQEAIAAHLREIPVRGPAAKRLRNKQALYSYAVGIGLHSGHPLELGARAFYEMLDGAFDLSNGLYYIAGESLPGVLRTGSKS